MDEQTIQYALDYCLANPEGLGTEELLDRFPELREELAPLLALSSLLQEAPEPVPTARREAMKARLMRAAASNQATQPLPQQPQTTEARSGGWRFFFEWLSRPSMAIAVAAVLLFAFAWSASASALPDSPFYNVRLLSEDITVNLAQSSADKFSRHTQFAESRLADLGAMSKLGKLAQAGLAFINYDGHLQACRVIIDNAGSQDDKASFSKSLYKVCTKGEIEFGGFQNIAALPQPVQQSYQASARQQSSLLASTNSILQAANINPLDLLDQGTRDVLQTTPGPVATSIARYTPQPTQGTTGAEGTLTSTGLPGTQSSRTPAPVGGTAGATRTGTTPPPSTSAATSATAIGTVPGTETAQATGTQASATATGPANATGTPSATGTASPTRGAGGSPTPQTTAGTGATRTPGTPPVPTPSPSTTKPAGTPTAPARSPVPTTLTTPGTVTVATPATPKTTATPTAAGTGVAGTATPTTTYTPTPITSTATPTHGPPPITPPQAGPTNTPIPTWPTSARTPTMTPALPTALPLTTITPAEGQPPPSPTNVPNPTNTALQAPTNTPRPTTPPPPTSPPATPTSAQVGSCNLHVDEVSAECSSNECVQWTAQVNNRGSEGVTAGWIAELQVKLNSGGWQVVAQESGNATFPAGETMEVAGEMCYSFPPATTGVKVAFRTNSGLPDCDGRKTSHQLDACTP